MKAIIKVVSIITSAVIMTTVLLPGTSAADTDTVKTGSFSYAPALIEGTATDSYFYSDSYFDLPSDAENEHLTTMSMALALSTMEEYGSSYVTALLDDIGFEDIAIGDMNDIPTRNTIGTAIAHKKVNGRELVAVAIRGSKYGSEWASNLTAGAEGDIQGFSEAAEKVIGRIRTYIAENELKDIKLWITGYSRAGSVADLTGVYINEHTDEFSETKRPINIISKTQIYDGVYSIKYQAASLDAKLQPVYTISDDGINQLVYVRSGFIYEKTVVDLNEISYDIIEGYAKEALYNQQIIMVNNGESYIKGVAANGIKFEGWIDDNELKSFYPVEDWQY